MKFLVLALTVFAIGCSKDSGSSRKDQPAPTPAPKSSQPAPTGEETSAGQQGDTPATAAPAVPEVQAPEKEELVGTLHCDNVDAEKFIKRAAGTWQPYAAGLKGPNCMVVNTNEVARKFVSFDRNSQELDEYQANYGSMTTETQACKEGAVPSGTRIGKSSPEAYELCQSAVVTGKYGPDFYVLKLKTLARIVGFKKDSQGRDVLMWDAVLSNNPNHDSRFIPHINHNDFKSVSIVK